ncbi:MAG: CpsD/CapB family tyrosine-protein kinase [Pseudomonadota bacterium]
MERLQAAIEKARDDRDRVPPRRGARIGGALDAAWARLNPLHLDGEVLQNNRIFTAEAGPLAASFDILRTRVLRTMQQNGWKRLAITSATPECGKSTIALNLAFAMARQPNMRTLQVELDMRRPSQQRLLGLTGGHQPAPSSVADLLSGDKSFADIALNHRNSLALVTNGQSVQNPSDILLSSDVGRVLSDLERTYQFDMVICDMPPSLISDDMIAFTSNVDCALIVAAAEASTAAEIDKCERDLSEMTNVLGVVLNKYRLGAADSAYPDQYY